MGRLAIRKIIYHGKKFFFESPELKDGIVIIEGENGHGKSTLMELIYYALGGKVVAFEKDNTTGNKHNEIYNDEDNYIEMHIEINQESYEITRYIGYNQIFIVDSKKNIIETDIYRNSQKESIIFSDWILDKLHIDVFDIIQGTRSFKLNFTDLFRLIYHDQTTEVDKIYKRPDNSNFLTDSLEIRKAIFEVLVGKSFNKYYSLLGEYKISQKNYEKAQASLENYDEFLSSIMNEDLSNVIHISDLISEKQEAISKIKIKRELVYSQNFNTEKSFQIVDEQQRKLGRLATKKEELNKSKNLNNQSISKIIYLLEDAKNELNEIEKIRLVNKKLNLFTPNTCPYCLIHVERQKDKCICGNLVDEEQYEKFFYKDTDYMSIINSRQKSIQSLSDLLVKKKEYNDTLASQIEKISGEIVNVKNRISDLNKDIVYNQNNEQIRMLDEEETKIKNEILELERAKELAEKMEVLVQDLAKCRHKASTLKNQVEACLLEAKNDIQKKRLEFSNCYQELMKLADEKCYDAYIGDDYMPVVNRRQYRERSSQVPKRLMYFLTLLIESLATSTNFPQFLLIDTPNKEGIDSNNLIKNLKLLLKANEISLENDKKYQIILTTGIDTYPIELKNNIVLSLNQDNYLLQEK